MKLRKVAFFSVLLLGAALFAGYFSLSAPGPVPLYEEVAARGIAETGAKNLVAAVYLDYRLFDTLLEALLLLISVIGVSQFAQLSSEERRHPNANQSPESLRGAAFSPIMAGSLGPVYLLIALFAVYITVTGMDGPGGGFQGGTILAVIVISAHFAEGRQLLTIQTAEKLEKFMYALILMTGILFLFTRNSLGTGEKRLYLLVMNILIGLKVFSGLSMIYLHFMAGKNNG